MKAKLGVLGLLVLVVAVASFYAFAAETTTPAGGEKGTSAKAMAKESKAEKAETAAAEKTPAGETTGMKRGEMTEEEMMERTKTRMKDAGMPEGAAMKHHMMAMAEFENDEPIGLLAYKKDLKLTEEQVKKIQDIDANARKEASAILTPEQKEIIAKASGPKTVMGMQKEMMSKGAMGRRPSMAAKEGSAAEEAKETKPQEAKENAAAKAGSAAEEAKETKTQETKEKAAGKD